MSGAGHQLVRQSLPLLRASTGQPLVLVFARDWRQPQGETLEGIRAELRGFGAALLIVSRRWLFYFAPDDELEVVDETQGVQGLERLLSLSGVEPNILELDGMTVALLDGAGELRFRQSTSEPADAAAALLSALRLAGAEVARGGTSLLGAQIPRRELVMLSLVGALSLILAEGCKSKAPAPQPAASASQASAEREVPVELNINGKLMKLKLEPRVSLLDTLRERLGLTGTKKGCDHGQCGACTVLIDDRRVNACLTLAIMAQHKAITTIEGMADAEQLHVLQRAFVTEDALQCGYCTPGQIMSAAGLLKEARARTDDEVREQMSGNICRCGAYVNIVRAIQAARAEPPTPGRAPI